MLYEKIYIVASSCVCGVPPLSLLQSCGITQQQDPYEHLQSKFFQSAEVTRLSELSLSWIFFSKTHKDRVDIIL